MKHLFQISLLAFALVAALFAPAPALAQCHLAVVTVPTATTCYGDENGSIDLFVAGETGVTFAWSNGATTEDISGLAAGTYTVTVTKSEGCTAKRTTIVSQPSRFYISSVTQRKPSCNGGRGALWLKFSGGERPFDIEWLDTDAADNGDMLNDSTSNLLAGLHHVMVTDANGCESERYVNLEEPDGMSIKGTVYPVKCFGTATGKVSGSVTGAQGTKTYSWLNASGFPISGANKSSLDLIGVGSYAMRVTDGKGCTMTETFEVEGPEALDVTVDDQWTPTEFVVSFTGGEGGNERLNANQYTYSFTKSLGASPSYNAQQYKYLSLSSEGEYTAKVKDVKGCVTTYTGVDLIAAQAPSADRRAHVGVTTYEPNFLGILGNPTADVVRIDVSAPVRNISIVDLSGRVVSESVGDVRQVAAPDADGVYTVRVEFEDGSIEVKEVVIGQ